MALDTRDKRASSIAVGLGFGRCLPNPDGDAGTVQADRQHAGLSYRGIAAALPILADNVYLTMTDTRRLALTMTDGRRVQLYFENEP